jgi:excisionase family DNA binding protein
MLTLGQAARLTGTSKTTLTRAIKAGRLSAVRQDDGSYRIDPAELARVYDVKVATPETGTATGNVVHRATGQGDPGDPELVTRLAVAEAELRALKEMAAEIRQSRDAWQAQAERATLALTGPARRPWWRRLAG